MRRSPNQLSRTGASRVAGRRRMGAILSMELVLVLPIFLLVLFSVVEFSMLSTARTRLTDAARHGSRLLCLSDRSHDEVRVEVRKMLGPKLGQYAQVDINDSRQPGEMVNVYVRIPMSSASPDLLWMTGFSVRDRFLGGEAPMVREHDIATTGIDRL